MCDKTEDYLVLLIKWKIYLEKHSDKILGIQMPLEYNWKNNYRHFVIILKIFIYPEWEKIEDCIG